MLGDAVKQDRLANSTGRRITMTPVSAPTGVAPLLDVRDLRVAFRTPDDLLDAVSGLSFSVARGQVLGIVGESGSGKSVATQTMVGLTRGARVTGEALFEGQNLLATSPDQLRAVRGRGIAMVFQNPLSSLHPLYRIGWQIVEMIQAHEPATNAQARAGHRAPGPGRHSASQSPRG
jgi:peptide/nickel transport system ATP-binding protein